MLSNSWTTIAGIFGGIATYLTGAGAKFPQSKGDWAAFVWGLTLAVLGVFAKDATTGSAPK